MIEKMSIYFIPSVLSENNKKPKKKVKDFE